jgi:hypothetical protein
MELLIEWVEQSELTKEFENGGHYSVQLAK